MLDEGCMNMQVQQINNYNNNSFKAGKIKISNKEFWPERHLMAFANNKEYQELAKSLKPEGKDLRATIFWNQDFGDYQIRLEAVSEKASELIRQDWCANIYRFGQQFPLKNQKMHLPLVHQKTAKEQALDLIENFNKSQNGKKHLALWDRIKSLLSKLF